MIFRIHTFLNKKKLIKTSFYFKKFQYTSLKKKNGKRIVLKFIKKKNLNEFLQKGNKIFEIENKIVNFIIFHFFLHFYKISDLCKINL